MPRGMCGPIPTGLLLCLPLLLSLSGTLQQLSSQRLPGGPDPRPLGPLRPGATFRFPLGPADDAGAIVLGGVTWGTQPEVDFNVCVARACNAFTVNVRDHEAIVLPVAPGHDELEMKDRNRRTAAPGGARVLPHVAIVQVVGVKRGKLGFWGNDVLGPFWRESHRPWGHRVARATEVSEHLGAAWKRWALVWTLSVLVVFAGLKPFAGAFREPDVI